jgi:hypothetical protein
MEEEKRFSVRFPKSILEKIKQAARDEKRSMNHEIVWAVNAYLKKREREQGNAALQKDQD